MEETHLNHVVITGARAILALCLAESCCVLELKSPKDMTFGGDMRDITVSYEIFQRALGFQTGLMPDDGMRDVFHAFRASLISNPHDQRYRNAQFIVQ